MTTFMLRYVNAQELRRYLAKQGCTFEPAKGSHIWAKLGDRKTIIPMHGAGKDLGTGLVKAILKDLDLK